MMRSRGQKSLRGKIIAVRRIDGSGRSTQIHLRPSSPELEDYTAIGRLFTVE
jgi:hypothetical protein